MGDDLSYVEIKERCKNEGILFEDKTFLADSSSLYGNPESETSDSIKWLRPKEIVSQTVGETKPPKFIHEGATRFDIKQGKLGNCWLLATIANLPQYKSVFSKVVPEDNTEFESKDYCGVFHFRFWQYGRWIEIVVDDRLPTVEGKLIYISSAHTNEFWSALVEKACAKLYGSYDAMSGGYGAESFEDLTGGIAEFYALKNQSVEFFEHLKFLLEQNSLIVGLIGHADENGDLGNLGLVRGHAYSITAAETITEDILLVRVRNPWGKTEWTGAWSDSSSEWNIIGPIERDELGLTFETDGEYWMNWQDFTKYFTAVEIGHFNPFCVNSYDNNSKSCKRFADRSSINVATVDGKWELTEQIEQEDILEYLFSLKYGNLVVKFEEKPEKYQDYSKDPTTLAKSPQYILKINDVSEKDEGLQRTGEVYKMVISLIVKNRRNLIKSGNRVFPNVDVHLYETERDHLKSTAFDKTFFEKFKPLNFKPGFNYAEEIIQSYSLLPSGEYLVVATSEIPAEFFLRVYCNAGIQISEILG